MISPLLKSGMSAPSVSDQTPNLEGFLAPAAKQPLIWSLSTWTSHIPV